MRMTRVGDIGSILADPFSDLRSDERAGLAAHTLRVVGSCQPLDAWLVAEPDELPASVAHVLADDERARLVRTANALEHLDDMTIYESRQGMRPRLHFAGYQSFDLRDDAGRKLFIDAAGHPFEKQGAWRVQPNREHRTALEVGPGVCKVHAERPAGQEIDLERAHEARAIARLNPLRGFGIGSGGPSVQGGHAFPVRHAMEPRAQRVIALGPREEAAHERAKVEPRAADEDRQPPTSVNVFNDARGVGGESGG